MTADRYCRSIRAELHAARCLDKDQSSNRYFTDGEELDRRMMAAGIPPEHPTTWGVGSDAYKDAQRNAIPVDESHDHPVGDAFLSPNPVEAL